MSTCSICGIKEATTKDHLPPKGIFSKPRPSDLITVPACVDCNNSASKYDEKFRVYLGLHVALWDESGKKLFKNEVLRTLKHNNKLKEEILKKIKPRDDGYFEVLWDSEAHDEIITRLIRGLFYYHFKCVLPSQIRIDTSWLKEPPFDIDRSELYDNSVANGDFVYLYNKVEESDFDSIWYFQFYNSHWAAGIIVSKESEHYLY